MKLWNALKSGVLGIVVFTATISNTQALSDNDLQKMEQKVQIQSMEHKKLQAQATQINLELTSVSREMIKSAKKIQNNEEKISAMERQLERLKTELQNAERDFNKEDENLIKTLAALQSLALRPTEALLVQPLTPVEIIRSAMLLRETIPFLEENANRIRKKMTLISNKKNLIEKQFAEISKQRKILEKEHYRMKALVKRKSQMRNMVEIKSEKAKKNVERLASQANDLRDLLNKLEQQRIEKQRKEEEQRRIARQKAEEARRLAEQNRKEVQTTELEKMPTSIMDKIGSSFKKAKGTLPMPARGKIITAYGERTDKGISAKGITIRTRNQAQVIAPFDGYVAFAGPFRGFGNIIIVEHGDGYLSLLAGMGSIDVEVGQPLLAGEPVGQMPTDGNAKLYVEIRKNNQPINPLAWINV